MFIRAQVRFQRVSDLPEDVVVNTFNFYVDDDLVNKYTLIAQRLRSFYTTVHAGQASNLLAMYSANIKSDGSQIRLYNSALEPMGAPVHVEAFGPVTGISTSTASLPAEVAMVLSYRADGSPAVPLARKRGRLYLGPFHSGVLSTNQVGDVRPAPALQGVILAAGRALAEASVPGDLEWGVHSNIAGFQGPTRHLFVDNAFDTQRRRGAKANSRVTFSLP